MIGFFKKFLKPKEESVQFSELDKWLEDNNPELQKVQGRIKEIEELKNGVVEKLEVLKGVDVSQAKVEDKVKSIVQGNLPAYVNAVNFFLTKIVLPEDINHVNLEIFCDSFEQEFKDLNKRTFRNFQIIKELVGKELEGVARGIKSLELLVKDVKRSSAEIKKIFGAREQIKFIKDSFENKEKNKLKKGELEKEKKELISSHKRLKKDIEGLKNSERAESLENLKIERKEVFDSIKDLDNGLVNLFSPLQKALKKYNNICFVKKVDSYIENPVRTLLDDPQFEILKFLKDVKKMVEESKIDLKEDKKKKMFESLDKLDESFLKKFVEERSVFREKLSSIKAEISDNTVLEDIGKLKEDFNVASFRLEDVEREIDKIQDVDIVSETKKLEENLSQVFGHKIKVENVMG